MNKEEIIRKLKENKKYVALIIIVLIISVGILVPTILFANKGISNEALYQKSKDGIYIEDFLINQDTITIKVYGKVGDCIHYHHKTTNDAFDVVARISIFVKEDNTQYSRSLSTGFSYGIIDWEELQHTGIYTITILNNDLHSGYIQIFAIIHSGNFSPDCPLC